jgi:hypothetical protein
MLDHIHLAGISQFFDDPWPNTDHHSLFDDIDKLGLLGATIATIPPPVRRTIKSKSKKIITKFIHNIEQANIINYILSHLRQLKNIPSWTDLQHKELEELDKAFTNTSCAAPTDFPWSPTVQIAATIHQYWLTTVHGKKHNIDVSDQTTKLNEQLEPDAIFQGDKQRSTANKLQHYRKNLINARLRADELRETYLDIFQEKAIEEGNLTKAEAIRQLSNKERQIWCWRTCHLNS